MKTQNLKQSLAPIGILKNSCRKKLFNVRFSEFFIPIVSIDAWMIKENFIVDILLQVFLNLFFRFILNLIV